ncbi:putative phosphothreonine lyase domain-containing protein [Halorubrum ejinorense]|uniref:Phosphothreonine lyase domain-containing protein n=1 Tax=Halorubrum ejinorense TaxID=425309 RepID=A0AAV3SQA5_9EURY
MVVDRAPTEIDDPGRHWLRAKDVTGFPRNARDGYFPAHDVTRPAATTAADLPPVDGATPGVLPTDAEAVVDAATVADADRLALDSTYLSGKWLVERPPEAVTDLWEGVVADVEAGRFWDAKVSTRAGCEAFGETDHAVLVFTPNYFDRADVDRVRRRLREAHGVTEEIRYRPDVYTLDGVHEETLGPLTDSAAARFRA